MSGDIRLIDRLAPVLDEIQRLDRYRVQLMAEVEALCGAPGPSEDEIAEVYWLEEIVPVKFLGLRYDVGQMAQWSVPAFMDTGLGCQLTELPIS